MLFVSSLCSIGLIFHCGLHAELRGWDHVVGCIVFARLVYNSSTHISLKCIALECILRNFTSGLLASMPFSCEREEADKVAHGADTWWIVLKKEFLFLLVQATVYYWGGGMGNRNGVPVPTVFRLRYS